MKADREKEEDGKCHSAREKWPNRTEMNEVPLAMMHLIRINHTNVSKKRHGNKSPHDSHRVRLYSAPFKQAIRQSHPEASPP
jgi:hypothetical protein